MPQSIVTSASKPVMPPRFITFEGMDGAGKTTQLHWCSAELTRRGVAHRVTREPGGTALGERIRSLVLEQTMHLDTEALLMFAARREHLAQVIEPALAAGQWVLCDRFTDASFAYQGGGRGMPIERLQALEQFTHPHRQPDCTFLFDVPLDISRQRMAGRGVLDRFEREDGAFHQRVRAAYLARAAEHPDRIRLIDAARPPAQISAELGLYLDDLL